ncbi:translation machinery-associated protein 46 [Polychytrium aggregatum]|uniref:translation machinery-associated protein 46 n=1 Tax=Polychytrium aggregatum TaxID=110093 RepID=UPI0022FDCF82|nr:translation machinery-associated protein 46 [Polychytrium aggregatum]KAI9207463.1 translation machinery-associated protein 46 [Polychytrium aggregatum]
MPPKNAAKKVVDDKTFGMKNKNKSAKAQKFIQQLHQQASQAGNKKEKTLADQRKAEQDARKKAEADRKNELSELFKPVAQQQKVPFGVDPKTVICAFFKQGTCQKGAKCKFSHDLTKERKDAKIDIYTDNRNEKDDKENDSMDTWDQSKLEDVVNKKHSLSDNQNKPTDIVCKHFIEAIESQKYGWFWECPAGGDKCKYRHALPPGFVLKKKETDEERRAREEREKANELTIEEFLETERHKLGPNLTPVTYESFQKWKEERKARLKAEEDDALRKRMDAFKQLKSGGKPSMQFSGRELFEFNPEMANTGDDEDAMDEYVRDESDHENDEDYQAGPSGVLDDDELSGVNRKGKGRADVDDLRVQDIQIEEELFDDEELAGLDDDDEDDE